MICEEEVLIHVYDDNVLQLAGIQAVVGDLERVRLINLPCGTDRCSPDLILFNLDQQTSCAQWRLREKLSLHPGVPILCYSTREYVSPKLLVDHGPRLHVIRPSKLFSFLCLFLVSDWGAAVASFERVHHECQIAKARLSNREREIFCLLGKGCDSREAATRLDLSKSTVDSHIQGIRRKMGSEGTVEIRMLARTHAHQTFCRAQASGEGHICSERESSIGSCPLL